VTAGQVAALIAAGAFALLVVLLAVPLIKLGRTLDEATIAIRKAHENSEPLLSNANTTIDHVNTQLSRVDGMTANARAVTANVSTLTALFTATLGGPLVKAAAFSYGLNRALRRRRKAAADTASDTAGATARGTGRRRRRRRGQR
jgi:predicted cobalt transporter CbtA